MHQTFTTEFRKAITWKSIRYSLTFVFSLGFWGYSGIRSAQAIVFSDFTDYLGNGITGFLTAANAPAPVITLVKAAMGIIPWLVLSLAGGVILWQAYEGYKEYERENFSGITKPITNILVIIILLYLADRVTSSLVKV
jgi:hypothetical protein